MNKWIFLLAVSASSSAMAADLSKTCSVVSCSPGDKAVTYSTKIDYYFACPTQELSEYVSNVLGAASASYQLTGKHPNISPLTGEPELNGEWKQMIDTLRMNSGASTFDQAQALCSKGKSKLAVTVMNNPELGGSIWVSGADKKPFWMPKAFLDKR